MSRLTAVVLAAGQGTRMRSKTPKVLHELCGRPLVAWPIAAAREAGAQDVVVVDGPQRPLDGRLSDGVRFAVQPQANGTGGAVQAAVPALGDAEDATVLVLAGDAPLVDGRTLTGLLEAHRAANAAATLLTAEHPEPAGYGRVVRDATGGVLRVVETKADGDARPEELAIGEVNASVYAFEAGALREALEGLTPDNAQGELYLTDTVGHLAATGRRVAAHRAADWRVVLGVNDRAQLADVAALLQRRLQHELMLRGVTIVDPATTHVDATVTLGPDTTIEPFTILRGRTSAGEDCRIGPHATLTDARLHDGVSVVHSHLVDCELHDGATVGPFAYLRPGTVLRAKAKAGTFVELKNSDVGEGTKVPHLSYLGDADVGAGTNIGASNVTANYDGVKKHRTRIGEGVKTSVDTTFVAPVSVGDHAWTAAGSVITEDVPDGALGVARARQTNLEGYDERRRRAAGQD